MAPSLARLDFCTFHGPGPRDQSLRGADRCLGRAPRIRLDRKVADVGCTGSATVAVAMAQRCRGGGKRGSLFLERLANDVPERPAVSRCRLPQPLKKVFISHDRRSLHAIIMS